MPYQDALYPTFTGYIESTMDALLLLEAALNGNIYHAARRPHDRERPQLIKSGSIFIYEECSSGIKRWTDGITWSPSRILGNFLIYRELKRGFAPGEKKRAMKRKRSPSGPEPTSSATMDNTLSAAERQRERNLVGSLIDSYCFKKDGGLMKKTISIHYRGVIHHIVNYYAVDDVRSGRLQRPVQMPIFRRYPPRPDLIHYSFRVPLEEIVVRVEDTRSGEAQHLFLTPEEFNEQVPSMQAAPPGSGLSAGVVAPYGGHHPYGAGYQAPGQYDAAVTSAAMPPPMTAQAPHPISAPLLSHDISSTQPALPQPIHAASDPIGFLQQQQYQANYSLGHGLSGSHPPSSDMANEYPRNMPSHVSPRQAGSQTFYGPSVFPASIQQDSGGRLGSDASSFVGSQQYDVAQGNDQAWTLDEAPGDLQSQQQYYGAQVGGGSEQWHGNNNNDVLDG